MILVSFFSEDNALSDEIKICYTFEYQNNENRAFPLFGTPGIAQFRYLLSYVLIQMNWKEVKLPITTPEATNIVI